MAKHRFIIGVNENDALVGSQCARCNQIVLFENGKIPDDILTQECPRGEDVNQAAARVVREATEKW